MWEGLKHRDVVLLRSGAGSRKAGNKKKKRMCNNPHARWENRRDCVTAQKAQPGAPFSKRRGALGHEKEEEKNTLRLEAGVNCHRQVHQKKKSPRSKTLHGYQLSSNFCTTAQLRVRCYCNHLLEQVPPCAAQ